MSDHLLNEEFLTKITSLFQEANSLHRNVRVSMKRIITPNEVEKPKELDSTNYPEYDVSKMSREYMPVKRGSSKISRSQYSILLRAVMGAGKNNKSGSKTKLSTVVKADDFDHFWQLYSTNVKAGMKGLSKKKKKNTKPTKVAKNVIKKTKKIKL